MGRIRTPEKSLLFIGALFSDQEYYLRAYGILNRSFGEVAMESSPFKWDFSDHYRQEMGAPLYRRFLFFRKLIDPGNLADIKLATNEIERSMSVDERRLINLDPGYLTLAKIVLASTKDYSHRIYLKEGIHAEVTLIYSKETGQYIPNINTYNDYKDERHGKIFLLGRELLQMRNRDNTDLK
jgi:hypothetical protein